MHYHIQNNMYIFITNDNFLIETEWYYLSLSMIACILQADV